MSKSAYLNNKEFEATIANYRMVCLTHAPDTVLYKQTANDLAAQFYLLAHNLMRGFKFAGVEEEDGMQELVMLCFNKLHRFDPDKGKAFNFCTTVMLNHLRQMYRTSQAFQNLRSRFAKHLGDNLPHN